MALTSHISARRLTLAAPVRQTREELTERIAVLRAQLAEAEHDHRRRGEELARSRHELNSLRAQLRSEPPTEDA
jgi:hypothetical protein